MNIPLAALTTMDEVFLIEWTRYAIHAVQAMKIIPLLGISKDKRKSRFTTAIAFSELKTDFILSIMTVPPDLV